MHYAGMGIHRIAVVFRTVRIKREWRQKDVAARAKLSPSVIARHERDGIEVASMRSLIQHAEALDLRLDLVVRGDSTPGLRDDEHAAVVDHMKRRLERSDWDVIAEASFSEYGERGRVDLLAWHPETGMLLIVEVKTILIDVQEMLGALDIKERLAGKIAAQRGWRPRNVSVMLVVTDTDASRGRIARLPALFAGFKTRGAQVSVWIGNPIRPTRLLHYVSAATVGRTGSWRNGRQRVRRARACATRPERRVG